MGIFALCLVEALKVVFIPVVCIICRILALFALAYKFVFSWYPYTQIQLLSSYHLFCLSICQVEFLSLSSEEYPMAAPKVTT
jgi:hypothetical protein